MCPPNAKDRTSQIAQNLQVIEQYDVRFKKCMCSSPLWSFWWKSIHPGRACRYRKFNSLKNTRSEFKKCREEREACLEIRETGDGNGGGSSKRARGNSTGAAEGGGWRETNVHRTGETDRSLVTPPPASRSPVQGGGADAGTPSVLSVDDLRDFGLQEILPTFGYIAHLLKWFLERERKEQMSRRASSSEENERWAVLENLINMILRAPRELYNPDVSDKLLDDVFGALKLTLLRTPYKVSSGDDPPLVTVQDVLAYAFEKCTGKSLTSKCSLTNVFSYLCVLLLMSRKLQATL
jgi:hypothetical protein